MYFYLTEKQLALFIMWRSRHHCEFDASKIDRGQFSIVFVVDDPSNLCYAECVWCKKRVDLSVY